MRLKHLVQSKTAIPSSTQDGHKDVPTKGKKGKVARLSKFIKRAAKKVYPHNRGSKDDNSASLTDSSRVKPTVGAPANQLNAVEGGAKDSYMRHGERQLTQEIINASLEQHVPNTLEGADSPGIENELEGNGDGPHTQGTPLTQDVACVEGISIWDWAYGPPKTVTMDSDNTTTCASTPSVVDPLPSNLIAHASIQSMYIEETASTKDEATDDRAASPPSDTSDTSLVFSELNDEPQHPRVVSDATTLFTSSVGSTQTITPRKASELAVDNALEIKEETADTQNTIVPLIHTETISDPVEGQEEKPQVQEDSDVVIKEEGNATSEEEADLAPEEDTTDANTASDNVKHALLLNDRVWEAAFTSRGYSHANEIEDLKDDHADELKHQKDNLKAQHANELAELRGNLEARFNGELMNLKEAVKTTTNALHEQSELLQAQNSIAVLYNELQERHARTVRNLEGQEEITQDKDQEVLQLRKRIYDAANDFDQEKHRLQAENARFEREYGLLKLISGRDKILYDETTNKLASINYALEDDPGSRNVDQEQLLNLREKQLADSSNQLHELSGAFRVLEHESKRKGREAEDRMANLGRSLELETEKCKFLSDRNKYLEEHGEDIYARIQNRMGEGEILTFCRDRLSVIVSDNSHCTKRVIALEEELQKSEAQLRLEKEQHRELSEKYSKDKKVLDELEEEKTALIGRNDSLGFSIDSKVKEVNDLTEAKAQGEAWRDREIERLSNLLDTLGRSDASNQIRWALDRKDSVIKRLEEGLKVTQSQLSQLQRKMAEAEWSAGNDQELAGYSNYLDEKRQERLEELEAELEELRAAAPGYYFQHRQEAFLYKEQLDASKENANNLKEQLEKLQETYNLFKESSKMHVKNIQDKATQSEDQLRARNKKLQNLGYRVYTQMMWLVATTHTKNKAIADDTWDALLAECLELFAETKENDENEIYDADGFLRESREESNHNDNQEDLIPLPLFSKENTPEPQDVSPQEDRDSRLEDASDRQDDAEPTNRGLPGDFTEADRLLRLVAPDTSDTSTPTATEPLEQGPSSFASNAATTGSSSLELSNATVVRRPGDNDDTARPDKKDEAATSDPHDDLYNLSEEERKALNDTGRFPDRFALPSTQIEEQKRFLYDGSDDEGEVGEERDFGGAHEQDEDEQEGDEQDRNQSSMISANTTGGSDVFVDHFTYPYGLTNKNIMRWINTGELPVKLTQLSPEVMRQNQALFDRIKDEVARNDRLLYEDEEEDNEAMAGTEVTTDQDEKENGIFSSPANSNSAKDINNMPTFNFNANLEAPPKKIGEDIFPFGAGPDAPLCKAGKDIFSFGNFDSSTTNDGKGIFNFIANQSLPQDKTSSSTLNKPSPTAPKLGFRSSAFRSMGSSKHDQVKDGLDEDNENDDDSNTGTVIIDTPPTDMDSPPLQSTNDSSDANKLDDQAESVNIDRTPARIPISTITSLYSEETASPSTAPEDDLDLSAIRDGQPIPISYTLPAVKGKKIATTKVAMNDQTAVLKVGGRRIQRRKMRLW